MSRLTGLVQSSRLHRNLMCAREPHEAKNWERLQCIAHDPGRLKELSLNNAPCQQQGKQKHSPSSCSCCALGPGSWPRCTDAQYNQSNVTSTSDVPCVLGPDQQRAGTTPPQILVSPPPGLSWGWSFCLRALFLSCQTPAGFYPRL